jgi:hypothetical protein
MAKLKKVWSGKFTMISNEIFDDWRLSYKEIGLYCNMMKFPDDWDFSIRNLAARHREKRDAVKTGLDKLLEYGYVSRQEQQARKDKGRFGSYYYVIYEDPHDNENYIPCPAREEDELEEKSPYTENPYTEVTGADNPYTENPYTEPTVTDYPYTDEPYTENPTTTNTVFKKTVISKTEEEDVTRARVNPDVFRDKVKSRFMSKYFSYSGDETAQTEMTKALNAILNALPDITDEKAVDAVNNCSREDASNLWEWVYQEMFNTTDLGVVMREDIHDKHGYLVKVIPNHLGLAYGPNPMESWGIRM